ncbi:hypothetical protein GCM10009677_03220 [Sphaerisporangium rubeum]|uniref:Restriction endonuclease type IV Mrr domain-containing protein n=1 Tax=Sphaerisporangium rubeum TaxID=321317 RepID=A0A7X0IE41_9ACTN|nr:restriction endonuclease [Sphaerisporangium rubeum]MBB6473273.1 hypothetical protein [Sphaerisporangium rubeum]
MPAWDDYQEKVASFFRSIGLEATVKVTLQGVRTSHEIDVVVRSSHVGFDLMWLVECKYWQRRVSKLHVLGLREIVSDTGADRGIIMSESGFQSGAADAAHLTNVQLTSLADLSVSASGAVGMAQLRMINERMDFCRDRYWSLKKADRIKYKLRTDGMVKGYEGWMIIGAVDAALSAAFRGAFPVTYSQVYGAIASLGGVVRNWVPQEYDLVANTPVELCVILEPEVAELERRLDVAEAAMRLSE